MNRRDLLKGLSLLSGLLFLPKISINGLELPNLPPHRGLTIDQIMAVCYPAALADRLNGHNWVSPELRRLERQGRLTTSSLGAVVCLPQDPPPNKYCEISEIDVPMAWSKLDDVRNETENKKISFVKSLIENAIESHDNILLQKIGTGKAIASKQYRYDRGNICELPNQYGYMCKLYTAIAFLDEARYLSPL